MPKIKNFEIDDNLDYKIIKNYLRTKVTRIAIIGSGEHAKNSI